MKKTLIILVLLFSSSVLADDILDFEMEGVSIGDTLLAYFSKEEINNFYKIGYPSSDKFLQVNLDNQTLKTYDIMTVSIKKEDYNYLVYEIKGFKRQKSFTSCLNQKDIISDQIKESIENYELSEYVSDHTEDITGQSKYHSSDFYLKIGSIRIFCVDWSDEMKKRGGYYDESLTVVMNSKEFENFLNNEAYK